MEYDGEIKLRVELNPEDVKRSAKKMQADIDNALNRDSGRRLDKSLRETLQTMGKTADEAAKIISKMEALEKMKIPTDSFILLSETLKQLDASIINVRDKLFATETEMAKIAQQKTPTKEYEELGKYLQLLEGRLEKLGTKSIELQNKPQTKKTVDALDEIERKAERLNGAIEDVKDRLWDMEAAGKAFTLGTETGRYKELQAQAEDLKRQLDDLTASAQQTKNSMDEMSNASQDFTSGVETEEYERLTEQLDKVNAKMAKAGDSYGEMTGASQMLATAVSAVSQAFNALRQILTQVDSLVTSVFKKLHAGFDKLVGLLKRTNRHSAATNVNFKKLLRTFLRYVVGVRSLYVLVNKVRTGITAGIKDLARLNEGQNATNAAVSKLVSSLEYLRNAWAVAFSPIIQLATPMLETLMDVLAEVGNRIARFMAVMQGNSSYTKAIKRQKDWAKSLDGTAKSAENASKQLSGLDKLNVLSSKTDTGGAASDVSEMFEDAEIDGPLSEWERKFKDFLETVRKLFKNAWANVGQDFINAWEGLKRSISGLFMSILDDVTKVLGEEATQKIAEDVIKIGAGALESVQIVIDRIKEAWETDDLGYRILSNVRDIVGIIIGWILKAVDATKEWVKELDFVPLFEQVNGFLEDMKPAVDAVMGILYDFYTKVLLPLGKWTIEKGLPMLLQTFRDFLDKVDWDKLRERLAELWDHIEPFAETVGEGLVIFIGRVTDALADFINSETFEHFLKAVEDWMDSVEPEDVANGLQKIVEAIIALKLALAAFSAVSGVATMVKLFGQLGSALALLKTPLMWLASALLSLGSKIVPLVTGAVSSLWAWLTVGLEEGIANFAALFGTGLVSAIAEAFAYAALAIASIGLGSNFGDWISEKIFGTSSADYGGWWGETKELWDSVAFFFTDIADAFRQQDWGRIGMDILSGIVAGILAAAATIVAPFRAVFDWIWNGLKGIFGISSPAKEMYPIGEFIIQGIGEGFIGAFNYLTEKLNAVKDFLVDLVTGIGELVKAKFTEFLGIVIGKVTEFYNRAVYVFSAFKSAMSTIWNGIYAVIKTPVNSIITAVEKMCNGIIEAVNRMLSALSGIKFEVPEWAPVIGGKSFNLGNLPQFEKISIPRLAQGAVIPPNREFMAVLGDQTEGTNVEAPLSTIKRAVAEVLSEMGYGDIEVPVQIDGREIARAVVNWNNQYKKQHGGRTALG